MNQMHRKSLFWSLAAPVLIYMGVRLAVEMVCVLVISIPYLADVYEQLVGQQALTMEEMTRQYWTLMEPAMEHVFRYATEIAGVASLITIPVNAWLFTRDRKLEMACDVEPAKKAPVKKYWTILVFGLAVSIAATCFFAMVELAFYSGQTQSASQITYMPSFPVQIAVLGVIVPIAEELMFRGVLFRRFMENRGFWYSALWSSLFFVLMHQDGAQMAYALLLGIFLCYVYEKFGSLKAPVLLHVAANCSSLLYTELGVFRWIGGAPVRMAGAVIAGAFVCSAMYVLIQRTGGAVKKEKEPGTGDKTNMF